MGHPTAVKAVASSLRGTSQPSALLRRLCRPVPSAAFGLMTAVPRAKRALAPFAQKAERGALLISFFSNEMRTMTKATAKRKRNRQSIAKANRVDVHTRVTNPDH